MLAALAVFNFVMTSGALQTLGEPGSWMPA